MTPMGPGPEYLLINIQGLQHGAAVAATAEIIIESGVQGAVSKHLRWTWAVVRITDQCTVHHTRVKLPLFMLCSDTTVVTVSQISRLIE